MQNRRWRFKRVRNKMVYAEDTGGSGSAIRWGERLNCQHQIFDSPTPSTPTLQPRAAFGIAHYGWKWRSPIQWVKSISKPFRWSGNRWKYSRSQKGSSVTIWKEAPTITQNNGIKGIYLPALHRSVTAKCKGFLKSDHGVLSNCFSSSWMSLFPCSKAEPATLVIV